MSAQKSRAASARERQRLARAQRRRDERRRRLLIAGGAVAVVVLVIAGLVVAKLAGVGSGSPPAVAAGPADAVTSVVTSVPASTLDKVGTGTVKVAPQPISAPPLLSGGNPKVLYVGAEYCPFCAAQRWPVVVALSRFGTFSGLGLTHSAGNDVDPNTPSLTFHGASYHSDYLAFTGVETSTNKAVGGHYEPLDQLSAADQETFSTYNRPPYVSKSTGSIPFIDIAGAYVSAGASFDPALLHGKTQEQVAAALKDPSSPIARAVDGSANLITAALCQTTNNEPHKVCLSRGVQAATAHLATP